MSFGMSMTVALLVLLESLAAATSATLPPDPHRATKFALLGIAGGLNLGLFLWSAMERKFKRSRAPDYSTPR
jgi:hypothetical protein